MVLCFLYHVDQGQQGHIDDGNFILITAVLAAGGGIKSVRLILPKSGMLYIVLGLEIINTQEFI